MPGQPWTQEELDSLLRQVIVERKPLPKLSVPGKTTAAINNQRRRLKEAGLLKNSFTGLRHVPWTICELRQLARLTGEHGFSAAFIAQLQLIPGRSQHAISKMMGRHGLGSPSIKSRARNARRLTPERRRELEGFLREEGRFWPSAAVAGQWSLAAQTVNGMRRRLGLALSWKEARASEAFRKGQERRARAFANELHHRWQKWRAHRERRFRAARSQLAQSPGAPPRRICVVCGEHWFATRYFFHVQTRQRVRGIKTSMSRTCRLCRAAQRRERDRELQKPARPLAA